MLLIRLDVTNKIGTGHFKRSCNLIKHYKDMKTIFLIKTDDKKNEIFKGYNIHFTCDLKEEDDLLNLIKENNIKAVILDFFKYEPFYIEKIKKKTKLPLITFHEYQDYSKNSDLTINYNVFPGKKNNHISNILLGYKYIIFDDNIKNYINNSIKKYIFVSFGGSDPTSFTNKFIENIAMKLPKTFFYIHRGAFFKEKKDYKKIKNIKLISYSESFFQYMSEAKKVVVAGGNMMYESIYLKKETLVVSHNHHQEQFAKIAQNKKLIKFIEKIKKINYISFAKEIEMEDNNNISENYIDNNGKDRIIKEIEKLF